MARRTFNLEVLTPDGPVLSAKAVSVIAPAADGQIGILGGHSPLMAMIGSGRLAITDDAGEHREFFISGGFMNVRENDVSVLPERCMELATITPAAARSELDQAQSLPSDTAEARARRQDAVAVAQAKVRVAK